jgi:hypothetical protein
VSEHKENKEPKVEIETLSDDDLESASGGGPVGSINTGTGTCGPGSTNTGTGLCQ